MEKGKFYKFTPLPVSVTDDTYLYIYEVLPDKNLGYLTCLSYARIDVPIRRLLRPRIFLAGLVPSFCYSEINPEELPVPVRRAFRGLARKFVRKFKPRL